MHLLRLWTWHYRATFKNISLGIITVPEITVLTNLYWSVQGRIVVACKLGPEEKALDRRFGAPHVQKGVKRKTEKWQDLGAFKTRCEETEDLDDEMRQAVDEKGQHCPSLKG